MNRVGLFFGSFDPPHIGHANVVMGVVNSKLVDKVLVIPAYQNVWKSNSSEFSYRLAMCRMTFSPLAPEVYVNAVEKSMYVPSYSKGIPTYDVLMELKSQMPNNELVIITTPETYSEIPLWHNGSTILKNYKFITLEDCPQVHYVGGYECDTDRDSAMTTFSDVDIAFLRGKSKWKSGTAENILRRHNMSSN